MTFFWELRVAGSVVLKGDARLISIATKAALADRSELNDSELVAVGTACVGVPDISLCGTTVARQARAGRGASGLIVVRATRARRGAHGRRRAVVSRGAGFGAHGGAVVGLSRRE